MQKRPPSIWRLFQLAYNHLTLIFWRVERPPKFALHHPPVLRNLRDPPRKRPKQAALAFNLR